MDNQQPDESISNRSSHVHHYVLKGSGLSCWAECDDVMACELLGRPHFPDTHIQPGERDIAWCVNPQTCGEKLAGDNGPIVGSKGAVERAIEEAT